MTFNFTYSYPNQRFIFLFASARDWLYSPFTSRTAHITSCSSSINWTGYQNVRMFLYLETCFPRVTVSVTYVSMPVTSCIKIHIPVNRYLINEGRRNCSTLWPTQQRNRNLWNMFPNRNICENGRLNFSENLRIVALKSLELTWFASPNRSIYLHFVLLWVRCDVDIFKLTDRA